MRVATGHYARVEFDDATRPLAAQASRRSSKDQTYFLFGLTQEQLSRTIFPLGDMTKPEVRELARQHGLALAEKPDSQEICFVPGGDYKRFIDAYFAEQGEALPDTAGDLVTTERRRHRRASRHSQLHRGPAQGIGRGDWIAALRDSDQGATSRSWSAEKNIFIREPCARGG
jgi:tRNA-specific 2-thiouridylase